MCACAPVTCQCLQSTNYFANTLHWCTCEYFRLQIFLTTNIFPSTVPVKRAGLTFLEGDSTLSQLHPSGILSPTSSPGSFLPPPASSPGPSPPSPPGFSPASSQGFSPTLLSKILPQPHLQDPPPSLIPRILPYPPLQGSSPLPHPQILPTLTSRVLPLG